MGLFIVTTLNLSRITLCRITYIHGHSSHFTIRMFYCTNVDIAVYMRVPTTNHSAFSGHNTLFHCIDEMTVCTESKGTSLQITNSNSLPNNCPFKMLTAFFKHFPDTHKMKRSCVLLLIMYKQRFTQTVVVFSFAIVSYNKTFVSVAAKCKKKFNRLF